MKVKALQPEAVSAIIVLALTGYFGYDLYLNYHQGVRRIREDFQRHQQTQGFHMKLAESLQEAEDIRAQLAPDATSESLLDHVNALAKEAGIEITSATPYPPRQFNQFIQPSVSLQVVTSYHRLGKFLSIVESASPFMRVDEVNVSQSGNVEAPASVRLTLSTLSVPPLKPE